MSMKPGEIEPIPEETVQLAHVVCPQDNLCLLLSDELGEGLCCKKLKEDKLNMKWLCLFGLYCTSKQLGDQYDLSFHISFFHTLQLSFAYHVHHLEPL